MKKLYDKAGSAFIFDHEHGGVAYVRPVVKIVTEFDSADDISFEPASYLVAMGRSELFDAPPYVIIDNEMATKQAELDALKAYTQKFILDARNEQAAAERELRAAKSKLETWMKTHQVMIDLGKLLDGQVLYPLSVSENHYHHGRNIPRIPTMRNAKYLAIESGDFEKGQKWACRQYGSDTYGSPFKFFDSEEEREEAIRSEFDAACQLFRSKPNFETTSYTTSTTLHYGTLMEWVKTHPALRIPDDIKAMKAAHDTEAIEKRKAELAAELASIDTGFESRAALSQEGRNNG